MLVSIIMAAYNGEEFIEKCVGSLINQSYEDFEIILYNDASKDNTEEIMYRLSRQYPNKVFVYGSNVNYGSGGAKSQALKYAKGEYIHFIDCDDYLENDFIEKLASLAKQRKDIDIILSGFTRVDEEGNILYTRTYKDANHALFQDMAAWGKLYKRDFLIKNNISFPRGKVLDDILFQAAVILANPQIAYIEQVGYFYVTNRKSITNTYLKSFTEKGIDNAFTYLTEYQDREGSSPLLDYYAFRYVCWHLLKSGSNVGRSNMNKEYDKAMQYLETYFPNFKKSSYVSFIKPKYERNIVKCIIKAILILYKMKLSKSFFSIYASLDLEKFWPKM